MGYNKSILNEEKTDKIINSPSGIYNHAVAAFDSPTASTVAR
jgi:hypothetical protein